MEMGEERLFHPQVMLTVKDFHGDTSSLKSSLKLSFEKGLTDVSGTVDFDRQLFGQYLIRRLVSDVPNILSLALKDTTAAIGELSALEPAERRQVVSEWNNTSRPFPNNRCAHELFVLQVRKTPESVAIIYGDQHFTYLGLNRRANQLAHYLNNGGVRPEGRIALCLERSPEMVLGILGVLKAGGGYLPLDPGYPPDRLAYMINDAQVTILLTQRRLLKNIPVTAIKVVCLDEEWGQIGQESEDEPQSDVAPGNLAYVIYTSGSTGEPKGVAVHHQALVARTTGMIEAYEMTSEDRLLGFVSVSFDAFGEEVFPILSCGARLVIDQHVTHHSARQILDMVESLAITILHQTVAYWSQFVNELYTSQRQLPGQCRLYIAGGESPSVEVLKKWSALTPNQSSFVNVYGPTETTITSTVYGSTIGASQVDLH
jgi:non-ribosomal peptide synthetase component F